MSKISELVKFVKNDTTHSYKEINFSQFPNFRAQEIAGITGYTIKGALRIISNSGITHTLEMHGDDAKERERGQIGVTEADFELIPIILNEPDIIEKGLNNRQKKPAILFSKCIGAKVYFVIMTLEKTSEGRDLIFKTMYIKRKAGA